MLAQLTTPTILQEDMGLFALMQKGGPIMWLILLCSIIASGVFIERMLYYHRNRLQVGEFLVGILNLLRRHSYLEALERCEDGHGPVAVVVRTAILKRGLPPAELREVVRETAQLQVPRLEANLSLLSTVAFISPLLGLLGTVTGMIEAFVQIQRTSGGAPVGELAGGIWTALITTAAGMIVAIPAHVAYNYLISRLQTLVSDMERAGIETIHLLTDTTHKEIIHLDTTALSVPAKSKPSQSA